MSPGRLRGAGLLLAVLAITVGWSAVLVRDQLAGTAPLVDRIDAAFTDLWFRTVGPRAAPAGVSIVALDDPSAAAFGYPLPRIRLAALIDRLADAGVAGVALDLLLTEAKEPEGDRKLVAAMTRLPVVLAAAAQFIPIAKPAPQAADSAPAPVASGLLLPAKLFSEVAGIGLVNLGTEPGGAVSSIPLVVTFEARLLPAMPLRLVAAATKVEPELSDRGLKIEGQETMLDTGGVLHLRFFGPRGAVPTLSAKNLLEDPTLAEPLRGQIVLIGSTVFGSGDTFSTPYDPNLPGVEVLATAASHLRSGGALIRTTRTRRVEAAVALLLPLVGLFPALMRSAALGAAAAVAVTAAWSGVALLAFGSGISLSVGGPLTTVATTLPLWIACRFWLDRRMRSRLEVQRSSLSAFHSPVLARHLLDEPEFLSEPVQRMSAVLFIDLSGFTGLSEMIGPRRTRDLLQGFHSRVADIVGQHDGMMLGFMGDGAMAVFGVIESRQSDAVRAVDAACQLASEITAWIETRREDAVKGVRVGAHYGPVILAKLGSASHLHITAMGDTVNVASRLLDAAKTQSAALAVSADLVRAARSGDDGIMARAGLGPPRLLTIRGRRDPVSVCFRDVGGGRPSSATQDLSPGY